MLSLALACWPSSAIAESAGGQAPPGPDGKAQPAFWRLPENDGINCLYMQMRLLGYGGSYDELRSQALDAGNFQTLGSLAMMAKRVGFHVASMKLTASGLISMTGPVIVHMEDEGIGSGAFCLFQGGAGQSVGLIEGSSVRWIDVPRDRFNRAWTGYALVPKKTATGWLKLVRRWAAVLLIGYVGLLLLHNRKPAVRVHSFDDLQNERN